MLNKFCLPKLKRFPVKRFRIFVISLVLFLGLGLPAIAATPKHYNELEFPPLPEIAIPEYTRYQLDNGMVVYLVEDRDLPLISGTAIIRTGSRFEPGEKTGLASLTGSLMRDGGTKSHPTEEINSILEQKAASIEAGIGKTTGSASFSSLTEDIDPVFGLFAEVLQEPVFDSQRLALAKKQRQGGLARRNDDPQEIADREFNKLVYGKTSPYGRTLEVETLANINRQDIVDFYQQYVRPESVILGIVGDFDTKEMKAKVEELFADWQVATPTAIAPIPEAKQAITGGVYLINKPDLTQSSVLMGHLSDTLKNPDYPALSVMNGLLNGFGGRLFNEVRSRQGLAYSVYGVWNPNFDYPGKFSAGGQTQTEATVPFIKAILAEIDEIQAKPVAEQELNSAKESILNSFVFNFQNPSQTLSRLMRYEYFGYPEDFIFQYQKEVTKTTVKDIQRVAQKYLKPEETVILVVGNGSMIDPPLTSLSQEVEPIIIPEIINSIPK